MSDQGSTYAVLQSVPVMVSPHYRLPKKIMVASELQMVPDDISKLPAYPFAVEREVIAQVEAARKLGFETEEAFALKKKQYEEEKANKRKAAARKIAPGFLDTDTRILKPEQTYALEFPTPAAAAEESEPNSTHTSPQMLQPSVSTGINDSNKVLATGTSPPDKFDYLKFEQGLAPADPWDTPENDMAALSAILGSPRMMPYTPVKRNSNPMPYPQQQQQQYHTPPQPQPQQQQRPYQKNEGVYWNFQQQSSNNSNNNARYPPPQQTTPRQMHASVPALPPKLFGNSPHPSSSTSSPIISPPPPVLPPPSDYHRASNSNTPTPPPLPPLPNQQQSPSPNEGLIAELGNMGFTRAQAIDALEKNDHDLIKATNFLLDQA